MSREMKLPELGENIESAEVVSILVAAGDRVKEEQPVIELETEKATAEVPASFGGIVKEIHVKAGDQVKVGQVLLTLDDAGAGRTAAKGSDAGKRPSPAPAKAPPQAAEIPRPVSDEPPAAATAASSPLASPEAAAPMAPPDGEPERRPLGDPAPAAPSVRRLAGELGIDIDQVQGSGPGGRISVEDLKAYARDAIPPRKAGGGGPAAPPPLPDFTRWGPVERQPMSGIRRATAQNLSRAWTTIPHVTQFDKADITSLEDFRKRHGSEVAAAGGKLTPTAIVVKVAAAALRTFPKFNASLDMASEEVIYRKSVHVGVAVDTERGLLVPVIRDADSKSLTEIAVELSSLAEKARTRKATADDLSGASFTITNLGGLGTTYFSPVVNWPQVAILGIGRAEVQPVFADGEFRPRRIMPLSLSYDHRLIDGADCARFLRWLAEALENPFLLLLEG